MICIHYMIYSRNSERCSAKPLLVKKNWTNIRVRIGHICMAKYLSERKCVFVWKTTTKVSDFIPHLL